MPTDRCIVVYDCPACARTLRPKTSDCCVFCSYADRPCPSIQDLEVFDVVAGSALASPPVLEIPRKCVLMIALEERPECRQVLAIGSAHGGGHEWRKQP